MQHTRQRLDEFIDWNSNQLRSYFQRLQSRPACLRRQNSASKTLLLSGPLPGSRLDTCFTGYSGPRQNISSRYVDGKQQGSARGAH